MESPVHVLMLSIQAVRGLPRLRAPGIVPCIISFSRLLMYVVLQFDKFVSGDVDLCNCTLLRRFHECVDVSDWYYAV